MLLLFEYLKELTKSVSCNLTLTVTVEKSFSVMDRIMTKLRNRKNTFGILYEISIDCEGGVSLEFIEGRTDFYPRKIRIVCTITYLI